MQHMICKLWIQFPFSKERNVWVFEYCGKELGMTVGDRGLDDTPEVGSRERRKKLPCQLTGHAGYCTRYQCKRLLNEQPILSCLSAREILATKPSGDQTRVIVWLTIARKFARPNLSCRIERNRSLILNQTLWVSQSFLCINALFPWLRERPLPGGKGLWLFPQERVRIPGNE